MRRGAGGAKDFVEAATDKAETNNGERENTMKGERRKPQSQESPARKSVI